MRATCCICSDILDEVSSISATACGHVYHTNCLMLWIGQCKTCPICRTLVKQEYVLRLYFDFPSSAVLNSSVLENEVLNLKAELSAKNIELDALIKQKEDAVGYVREAEKVAADLQQALYRNESEISELKLKVKSALKLEIKVLKLEKMNVTLTNDLQLLNNVQSIVRGTQKDVDDMIQECGNSSESSKQMAIYCTILKRELQKVIDSKNKLLEHNSKLKQENGRYAAKMKFYEEAMAISNKNNSIFRENLLKSVQDKENLKQDEINYGASTSKTPISKVPNMLSSTNIIDTSPLSVPFNKPKFNMNIIAPKTAHKSEVIVEKSVGEISTITFREKKDGGSIIRTGYNGLGGHSNFINSSSGIKKLKRLNRK